MNNIQLIRFSILSNCYFCVLVNDLIMSEINKTYNPIEVEDKWYSIWMDKRFFSSKVNYEKIPYTIVIPPPNVTGVLHMGHMLNNTIQDILIRKARMEGKEACWVPGTDHAYIATQAKVMNKLAEQGVDVSKLSREEFLEHAWEWTHKHGGIILDQLKKLGASCDWDRTKFTMDDDMTESVIDVFIDLFNKGLIYRGIRMVNWDPAAKTAVSDEEVIHKEVNSKLYYISYPIENSNEEITIATTRPETILGDSAICIHPNDERYFHLKGKKAIVPLINRVIPIIEDEYIDIEFGTGCLKVTPAHDINDYNIGLKHNLEIIDILNDDGTLNEAAKLYVGKDRFVVRKEIAKELDANGFLLKTEDHKNKVGYSERTNAVIEPKLSMQWFMKMEEISKPALNHVLNDDIQFHPPKFKNTYRHWMENIKDWCISRQLYWGQRIPAWYYGNGPLDFVVAKTEEQALSLASKKIGEIVYTIRQDDDVLDTWFSSWLWPIAVFDGIRNPDNEEIEYYYPTNDLVTAPEIMFFWVARMIISGYEYRKELPFKNVYYTGIVRDKQGRKMSKSLGNSPDPLELIQKYGADGVRVGMLLCSPAGNDLPFDESLCEQGRNFTNKIWNALRLIKSWEVSATSNQNDIASLWFDAKLNKAIEELENSYQTFRLSEALMTIYRLIWDDYCSWYLEMIKPNPGDKINKNTYESAILFFEKLMKLAHPFIPFITEEIWHTLRERSENDCIIVAQYPEKENINLQLLAHIENVNQAITNIRKIRVENNIGFKEEIDLYFLASSGIDYQSFFELFKKLANIGTIIESKPQMDAKSFIVGVDEFFIPIEINAEEEKVRILEEINYQKGFLVSVEKKLSNEKFVSGAPEQVVMGEKKKKADAEARIYALEKSLKLLN